jgi:type II secretory pathway component PulF
MKYDEFAFFNQQLAAMLRDGIPLEGALRRLCDEMRQGSLRTELQALEADLAEGRPIADALNARQLPDIYKRLVLVGVKSGNLPDALTMLADYFHRQNSLWIRLKGLMVYPVIVLFVAFLVSGLFVFIWDRTGQSYWSFLLGIGEGRPLPAATQAVLPILKNLWIFPAFFGSLLIAALAVWFVPGIHNMARWRLPAFKEASISRVASSVCLLLKGGVNLGDAIGLTQQLESNKSTVADLTKWRQNLAQGMTRFSQIAAANRVFPPLFVWLVSNGGEDMAAGFARAAELYRTRAEHRAEVALYTALPVAVLFLGAIVLSEAYLLMSGFLVLVDLVNNLGG